MNTLIHYFRTVFQHQAQRDTVISCNYGNNYYGDQICTQKPE